MNRSSKSKEIKVRKGLTSEGKMYGMFFARRQK